MCIKPILHIASISFHRNEKKISRERKLDHYRLVIKSANATQIIYKSANDLKEATNNVGGPFIDLVIKLRYLLQQYLFLLN